MKNTTNEMLELIQEVSLDELDQVIGGTGKGAVGTISHECRYNSWAFLATCCS